MLVSDARRGAQRLELSSTLAFGRRSRAKGRGGGSRVRGCGRVWARHGGDRETAAAAAERAHGCLIGGEDLCEAGEIKNDYGRVVGLYWRIGLALAVREGAGRTSLEDGDERWVHTRTLTHFEAHVLD